jgi:hypothetical protein
MGRKVESNSSVGSAHAAFGEVDVVVARSDGIEIVVLECLFIFGTLHELGNRVLGRELVWENAERPGILTLAMSLKTEIWASSKSLVTSFRLSIIAPSCPTALVILVAS